MVGVRTIFLLIKVKKSPKRCQRGLATIFDHIYFNMGVNQSVIKSNFYSPPFEMVEKIVVLKIVVLNACKLPKGNGDIEL